MIDSKLNRRKGKAWFFNFYLLLIAIRVINFSSRTVLAVNEQFTLDPMPTLRLEIPILESATARVSNATEFIGAYTNTSISRIVLNNDISMNNIEVGNLRVPGLTRTMQIDGGGHTLTFASTTGSNVVFRVMNIVTGNKTFHLKNIVIEKLDQDRVVNLISGGSQEWEYVFDDVTINSGLNFDNINRIVFNVSEGPLAFNSQSGGFFRDYRNATSIEGLELVSTKNVIDMEGMFASMHSLTELNLSSFDTSNVTNMSVMFWEATSLTELDVSGFDTSNVTDVAGMFHSMHSLTELDLSNFDMSNATNSMDNMLGRLTNLNRLTLSPLSLIHI